jgi:hypothetical protein
MNNALLLDRHEPEDHSCTAFRFWGFSGIAAGISNRAAETGHLGVRDREGKRHSITRDGKMSAGQSSGQPATKKQL